MKIAEGMYLVGSAQFGISAELDCHIYLIEDSGSLALIDSGAGSSDNDIELIIKNIKNEGFDPLAVEALFLTHAHSDHAGGAALLKERLGCKVISGRLTKDIVKKADDHELGLDFARKSGFYGDDYIFRPFDVDSVIEDGEELKIGQSSIKAIMTPGHSTDSTCYLVEKGDKRLLFTGDVVNVGGKFILLNCYGFSLKEYREKIKKLSGLNTDMLFPGHGVFTQKDGQSHVDILIDAFDRLLINSQLII